jgi:hypothetical protein
VEVITFLITDLNNVTYSLQQKTQTIFRLEFFIGLIKLFTLCSGYVASNAELTLFPSLKMPLGAMHITAGFNRQKIPMARSATT